MTKKSNKNTLRSYFQRQVRSFAYALNGLWLMTKDYNTKIHIPAALLVVLVGFLVRLASLEWIAICSAIILVWISEIFNTAIEKLVDYISLERTTQAKHIKDLAAAAVLLASLYAILIGLLVFGKRLWMMAIANNI